MSKKYDYFDEQDERIRKDQKQVQSQMEQIAKDQLRDNLKRSKEASLKMAEIAEAGAGTGGVRAGVIAGGGVTAGAGAGAGAGGASAGAGGTATGVGAAAGGATAGGGIAVGWKVALVLFLVFLLILLIAFLVYAAVRLRTQLEEAEPDAAILAEFPEGERTVNNAAYVLALLQNGDISLETGTVGAFDDDYAIQVLQAVIEEGEGRGEHISVSYEGAPWVLVEDAYGTTLEEHIQEMQEATEEEERQRRREEQRREEILNRRGYQYRNRPIGEEENDEEDISVSIEIPDFYVDPDGDTYTNEYGTWQQSTLEPVELHTTLSRRDIETTSFTNDYFADPYELRWQTVYALTILRVSGNSSEWGLTETDDEGNLLTLTRERMNEEGVSDYFLRENDILQCIECFRPRFSYYWNPLEDTQDGTSFTYDDSRMRAYIEDDQRDNAAIGGQTSLGGRAYVYHRPTVAARLIDLGYRTISFHVETIDEEQVIVSRTVRETPEEWLADLNLAAGGYFDEERFLFLLKQLPGTEDLVEQYREIFAAADSERMDTSVDGCVGAILRFSSSGTPAIINTDPVPWSPEQVTGIRFDYQTTGHAVILDFRNCYICQGDSHWGSARRGDGTIRGSGCIDCCFAMAAWYYNGACAPMSAVSGHYVDSNDWFMADVFDADNGMVRNGVSVSGFPTEQVKAHIDSGNPVIFKLGSRDVSGRWEGYHNSNSTHFILVCGYDENGIYVCDPGNLRNNGPVSIPYADMERAPVTFVNYMRSTTGATGRFLVR